MRENSFKEETYVRGSTTAILILVEFCETGSVKVANYAVTLNAGLGMELVFVGAGAGAVLVILVIILLISCCVCCKCRKQGKGIEIYNVTE